MAIAMLGALAIHAVVAVIASQLSFVMPGKRGHPAPRLGWVDIESAPAGAPLPLGEAKAEGAAAVDTIPTLVSPSPLPSPSPQRPLRRTSPTGATPLTSLAAAADTGDGLRTSGIGSGDGVGSCRFASGTVYANDMVLCSGDVEVDQCSAGATFCATGWHLCSTAEFLARGGTTITASKPAWLAGCVREGGGAVTPLLHRACSSCAKENATNVVLARACNDTGYSMATGSYVGVLATAGCYQVGPDGRGPEAHWQTMPAMATHSAAVCCR